MFQLLSSRIHIESSVKEEILLLTQEPTILIQTLEVPSMSTV